MVIAVLHVVEHAQLLKVFAVLEGTVLDHHLQVGVGVFRPAVGLPEFDGLEVGIALEGILADGDGLVVIVGSGVVVDAHGAVAAEAGGVDARHLCVPNVLVAVGQQAGGREVHVVGIPVAQRLHQALVAGGIVLHRLVLVVAHVAVHGAVHFHVGIRFHV